MDSHELRVPPPVLVTDLFAPEREALLDLLGTLRDEEWTAPTICTGWSVKDIAAHLLGDDLGKLSRARDGFALEGIGDQADVVQYLNRINNEWVQATRPLSPQVLCNLLAVTGAATMSFFRSVDLLTLGEPVSWAGPRPAPVWLDVAREYTERWTHQQQIRDALGKPALTEPQFLGPVLATFVWALPQTFRNTEAIPGVVVGLTISGEAGGDWSVVKGNDDWVLYQGACGLPDCQVSIEQDKARRLFTRGITPDQAHATVLGDYSLAMTLLETVSIIV
jgi:uncharacterized protein (TIGR03083 family)